MCDENAIILWLLPIGINYTPIGNQTCEISHTTRVKVFYFYVYELPD